MIDEEEFLENEIWFKNHSDFFPPEIRNNIEEVIEMCSFYVHVFDKAMDELNPKVRKLIYKQFPLLKTETRPLVLKSIDEIVDRTGMSLLFNLFGLLRDQKNGVDLREKYPDFESWISLYVHPPKPKPIDVTFYDGMQGLSDEQKMELVEEINTEELDGYNHFESRRFEFFDLIQKVVFNHYKALQELDGDGWNVYAIHVGMEYEMYCNDCYHIENFIKYKFPEEDINLSYPEYMKKLTQMPMDGNGN